MRQSSPRRVASPEGPCGPAVPVVFVAAAVPPNGGAYLSIMPPVRRILLRTVLRLTGGHSRPPRSMVLKTYCNDLDQDSADLVVERIVPEAPRLFAQPLRCRPAIPPCPKTYVKLLNDHSDLTPQRQDQMIVNLAATQVDTLPTGHLPMLSQPGQLAGLLNTATAQV